MSYEERKSLIDKLEKKRKSKIITLVTSDRFSVVPITGINSSIGPDQAIQIIEQLKIFEKKNQSFDKIDLLIYSRGGDINTAWIIVNSIRNYTKKFNVLIPLFSHSAATLIALGASEIVMTNVASISPVDPSVTNEFNPKENNISLPISVEDVTSYMSLAKDEHGVNIDAQDYITKAFEILADKVHPLALGNVKRSHTQIRLLAKKLLDFHITNDKDRIEKIVDALTEKFYSHFHLIFREEAKAFGLKQIKNADDTEEKLLWEIYKDYEVEMKMRDVFDVNIFLGKANKRELETKTVFIESSEKSLCFRIKQLIVRTLILDMNHRLQVLSTQNQYILNAGNLKGQLGQIANNLVALNTQILQFPAGTPGLQGIIQDHQQIINDVTSTIAQVPDSIDLDSLTVNFETKLIELGWM